MKYDLKGFGKRLLQTIDERYLTQTELAKKADMDKNNVCLYCNGKKSASPKTIVKMCVVLNCSPNWLTKGEGSVKDEFQRSLISSLEKSAIPKKLIATKIEDFIEIRFFVPQKDFNTFFSEAKRDGCLT